jgi:hypothetical protein
LDSSPFGFHPLLASHVEGKGEFTKIGQNGKPLEGYPELSPQQTKVVENHLKEIRDTIGDEMKKHRLNIAE